MELININPGLKLPGRQPYTITVGNRVFFVTYNEVRDVVEWNMFVDDFQVKEKIENILRNYLTNQ